MLATVRAQASVLAFEKMFLLAGIVFLLVLPLLLFLGTGRASRAGEDRRTWSLEHVRTMTTSRPPDPSR